MIWTIVLIAYYVIMCVILLTKVVRLQVEVQFLEGVRANQAHYIACLQSEISQLKNDRGEVDNHGENEKEEKG